MRGWQVSLLNVIALRLLADAVDIAKFSKITSASGNASEMSLDRDGAAVLDGQLMRREINGIGTTVDSELFRSLLDEGALHNLTSSSTAASRLTVSADASLITEKDDPPATQVVAAQPVVQAGAAPVIMPAGGAVAAPAAGAPVVVPAGGGVQQLAPQMQIVPQQQVQPQIQPQIQPMMQPMAQQQPQVQPVQQQPLQVQAQAAQPAQDAAPAPSPPPAESSDDDDGGPSFLVFLLIILIISGIAAGLIWYAMKKGLLKKQGGAPTRLAGLEAKGGAGESQAWKSAKSKQAYRRSVLSANMSGSQNSDSDDKPAQQPEEAGGPASAPASSAPGNSSDGGRQQRPRASRLNRTNTADVSADASAESGAKPAGGARSYRDRRNQSMAVAH